MVELFEQNIRTNERQSSKGNQLKWENEGIWYKADYTGYEGLAEYMISHLLKKSTLAEDEFVCYDLEKIKYGTVIYNGVKSKNFLKEDWQIITLERLAAAEIPERNVPAFFISPIFIIYAKENARQEIPPCVHRF